MIRLLGKVPYDIILACSGGVDSMAALDFLRRGKRNIKVAHFNHGTEYASKAEALVVDYCRVHKLAWVVGKVAEEKPKDESQEEFWRNARLSFFARVGEECPGYGPIVTAHQLDDAAEWWLYTAILGKPRLIPGYNEVYNLIRPFLLTAKFDLVHWARQKNVPYLDDPSNASTKHMRNRIRHNVMPEIRAINPGIHKTMRKLYADAGRKLY